MRFLSGRNGETAAGNCAVQIAALEKGVSLENIQAISARLNLASPR
jgi:hypothetical protein